MEINLSYSCNSVTGVRFYSVTEPCLSPGLWHYFVEFFCELTVIIATFSIFKVEVAMFGCGGIYMGLLEEKAE
jgi:hypothetical protein